MSEEFKELCNAYVELNKLHSEPGAKCHMLASSIHFLERLIKEYFKRNTPL